MLVAKRDPLILDASNPDCPACKTKRQHQDAEWQKYHPHAGHGFTQDTGWTKHAKRPISQRTARAQMEVVA
jgi:hypothetical protein